MLQATCLQLWEETAAKHVGLAAQLAQLAALATRWRSLELQSWRTLLARARAHVAAGASQAWFHLYRILLDGSSPPADVAVAVEQFIQARPCIHLCFCCMLLPCGGGHDRCHLMALLSRS